jgi:hypothetical protein
MSAQQSVRSSESLRIIRNGAAALTPAAEQSGAAAVQQLFGRALQSTVTIQPTPDENGRIGQQPRRLRDQAPLAETAEGIEGTQSGDFRGLVTEDRSKDRTLASVQPRPELQIDSSSFLALFAQAFTTPNIKPSLLAQAQPFARASLALEHVFAGNEQPAIDFAA